MSERKDDPFGDLLQGSETIIIGGAIIVGGFVLYKLLNVVENVGEIGKEIVDGVVEIPKKVGEITVNIVEFINKMIPDGKSLDKPIFDKLYDSWRVVYTPERLGQAIDRAFIEVGIPLYELLGKAKLGENTIKQIPKDEVKQYILAFREDAKSRGYNGRGQMYLEELYYDYRNYSGRELKQRIFLLDETPASLLSEFLGYINNNAALKDNLCKEFLSLQVFVPNLTGFTISKSPQEIAVIVDTAFSKTGGRWIKPWGDGGFTSRLFTIANNDELKKTIDKLGEICI